MEATDAADHKRQAVKHLGAAIRFLRKTPASPQWITTLEAIEKFVREWDISSKESLGRGVFQEERYTTACLTLNDFLTGYHYNNNKTFHVGHEDPIPTHPSIYVGVQDAVMERHLRQFLAGGCLWQGFSVEIKVVGKISVSLPRLREAQGDET